MENGEPTGVLIDNAMALIRRIIPEFSIDEKRNALIEAQRDCFAVGLTSVTDAGLDKDEIFLIDELHNNGKLKIRVYAMLNPTQKSLLLS